MSVILRTAGIDRSAEELEWDLNNLLAIWEAIKTVVVRRSSPFLIYRESDSVVRALRDYLTNEIGEILIDDEKAYNDAKEFIEQVMPHNLKKLKAYQDPGATLYALPNRIADRVRVRAHRNLAFGRQRRHRSHRSAGVHRHQLRARDQRRRHRGNRPQHQPRSGG